MSASVSTRWEYKYLVPRRVVPDLREYIRPFMNPDPYAERHPDYSYPICSLYLDSPDLRLYNEVLAGERNRFKLRIRCYSDDPSTPVFFEIKKRFNRSVKKVRARINRRQASQLIQGGGFSVPFELTSGEGPGLEEFMACQGLIAARPVVRVRYFREAYAANTGEPVRVTFDTRLMHAVSLDGSLSMSEGKWVETPVDGVILEIKFTEHFPGWVRDIAEMFRLRQQAVPKYVWSVDQVLGGYRADSIALGGRTMPPHLRGAWNKH